MGDGGMEIVEGDCCEGDVGEVEEGLGLWGELGGEEGLFWGWGGLLHGEEWKGEGDV